MQKYDEMVDSGVQWVGTVPREWSIVRPKTIFADRKEKSRTDDVHLTPSQKYSVLPQTEYMKLSGGRVVLNLTGSDDMKHVEEGDFVIHLRSFQGGIEYSAYTGKVSNAYTVLTPAEHMNKDFFRHVLKSHGFISELASKTDQLRDGQSIKYSTFCLVSMPLPDYATQQKVADFLDTETAKIDNLIAKQERLLQLLEEKRRATITHAVTRGLDPDVELKETNIPWLGKIPAHWNVKRLKDIFTANDEALGQKTDPEFEFKYVDISSVDKYRGITNREMMTFESAPSRARRIVQKGDIIIGAVRTYLEAIAQISEEDQNVIASTGFVVLRPKTTKDSDFYSFALRSSIFMASVVASSDGVSYPAINADKLMSLLIAVPNPEERHMIAGHCKKEMKQMDELKKKIQTQITLLRERRTSLISHTVTGKIKV